MFEDRFYDPTTGLFEGCLWRRARKAHTCYGCGQPIQPGERYIEWLGESHAYEAGDRYHAGCAAERGMVRAVVASVTVGTA